MLADVADVRPPAPHNVANALAAAALARSLDRAGRLAVPPEAVRAGLRAFDPGAHRIAHVATVDGVAYVDDSKATNPHAAAASLRRSRTSSGSPAGWPRAAGSTSWSRAPPTGCAAPCCSGRTAR